MIDDAGADERAPLRVPGDAPGIAGSLAEQLELTGPRIDPEHRAGEAEFLAPLLDDRFVEYAVEAVEIAVRSPRERVRQFMRVVAAEAGHDHFALVGLARSASVLQEQDVGRVADPHTAMPDGDARGDVQPVGEDGDLVVMPVSLSRFEHLD